MSPRFRRLRTARPAVARDACLNFRCWTRDVISDEMKLLIDDASSMKGETNNGVENPISSIFQNNFEAITTDASIS